jgi:hypothetical protein
MTAHKSLLFTPTNGICASPITFESSMAFPDPTIKRAIVWTTDVSIVYTADVDYRLILVSQSRCQLAKSFSSPPRTASARHRSRWRARWRSPTRRSGCPRGCTPGRATAPVMCHAFGSRILYTPEGPRGTKGEALRLSNRGTAGIDPGCPLKSLVHQSRRHRKIGPSKRRLFARVCSPCLPAAGRSWG